MKWQQCQQMPSMAFGLLWECWRLWPHGISFPAEWQSLVVRMTVLVKHDRTCPKKGRGHDDAAKRIYDTYHLHRTADQFGALGKWFAAALNDGTTDGQIYDSRKDAILHQHHR